VNENPLPRALDPLAAIKSATRARYGGVTAAKAPDVTAREVATKTKIVKTGSNRTIRARNILHSHESQTAN
jgi:hypothetical protein